MSKPYDRFVAGINTQSAAVIAAAALFEARVLLGAEPPTESKLHEFEMACYRRASELRARATKKRESAGKRKL